MNTNGNRQPILLLDLDDTILDFHRAEAIAIRATLTQLGIKADETTVKRYSEINRLHWEMLEKKLITRRQVLIGRFGMLFDELGIEADPDGAQKIYEKRLGTGHFFMPGAEETLEMLYGRCRMFICSNGTYSVQEGRIASAGISKYFENIFISEKIGHNKPDRKYFDYCFSQIAGFSEELALIVGDSLSSDIQGGINAGIKTCWFNPGKKQQRPEIRPDYEIDRLEELPALIDGIFGKA